MKDDSVSLGKQLSIVLLILLAAGAGAYWYLSEQASGASDKSRRAQRGAPVVEVASAEVTMLARRIEAVGTTIARQAVDIRPPASGQVIDIAFAPGSQVEAGDLLLRLDDRAERADLDETAAELRQAELNLERAIKLVAKKTIAQATVDELEAAFEAAAARLERAEKALKDRDIVAPFAGQVGLKEVNIGARVTTDTVITTLDDLLEIEVDFSVPEIFFGAVRRDQPIIATSAAFGDRTFAGSIETIDSRIDRVSRSFKVRAKIPNNDLTLPSGMFMLVDLTLAERDVLTIPEEAVLVADEDAYVFLLADGKVMRKTVSLGQREFGMVEIVDGLNAGDQVVVKGTQKVRDGSEVKVSDQRRDDASDQPAPSPTTITEPSA
ncbi:MAG: efflux RND transporter periplasmic adaptor subunit [Geminicoccales bacterium]